MGLDGIWDLGLLTFYGSFYLSLVSSTVQILSLTQQWLESLLFSHGSPASTTWTLIPNLKFPGTSGPFVPKEEPGSAGRLSGSHS